jgi:hypothetical protein
MSTISPLSPRPYQSGSLSAVNQQLDSKNLRTGNSSQQVKAQNDLVSLSKNGVDLQQRIDTLGNATVDYAQSLIGDFAQQLFGDAGKGATISFDSVELGASSSFAAGVQHSEDAKSSTDAVALSLTESAHFLGKGSITTADGRKFDFEVEIQYDHTLQTGASQSQSRTPATASPVAASNSDGIAPRSAADPLPPVEFPDIKFPGSLQDLFRLFDKPIKTDVVQKDDAQQGGQQKLGTLSLRLLHLVSSNASLDLYVANRNKAASEAYGQQDTAAKAPVTTPAPAVAPAATGPVGATGVANTDTQQASRAAKADTAAVA